MEEKKIIPFQPYLLRAAYDWLVDNSLTPYLEVNVDYPQVRVPHKYVQNGQIILDIAPRAVNRLKIDNEVIEFDARFGSKVELISIPIQAIASIYSHESGVGIKFATFNSEGEKGGGELQTSSESISSFHPKVIISSEHNLNLAKAKTTTKSIEEKSQQPTSADPTKSKSKPFLTLVKKNKPSTPDTTETE